jgi:hypothetical protein
VAQSKSFSYQCFENCCALKFLDQTTLTLGLSRFANEIEERYLGPFKPKQQQSLPVFFDSPFCDCVLLQTCVQEPFAKKVVIALAAMSSKAYSHTILLSFAMGAECLRVVPRAVR